jgi:hypothetical protein
MKCRRGLWVVITVGWYSWGSLIHTPYFPTFNNVYNLGEQVSSHTCATHLSYALWDYTLKRERFLRCKSSKPKLYYLGRTLSISWNCFGLFFLKPCGYVEGPPCLLWGHWTAEANVCNEGAHDGESLMVPCSSRAPMLPHLG